MWIPFTLAFALAADGSASAEDRAREPEIQNPLTLEAAEAIFREHGLDLLIAEAQVMGAEGDLRAAKVVQNPTLSGDYQIGFAAGSPSSPAGYFPPVPGFGVGLSDNAAIEDVLSGKRGLRIDVASRALEAAKLSRSDAERTLLTTLRTSFAQALLAEANLKFADEALQSYDKTRKLNQIRYDKGDINEADLSRIVVAQLEAEQSKAQAEAQLAQAKAAVAFLLGVRSHAMNLAIQGQLDYRPLADIEGSTADSLTQKGFAHRPDLLAAVASREQMGFSLAQARRAVVPDISLSATYGQQLASNVPNGIISPPSLTIGLSAPIPIFYQQQGEIRRAEANLLQAQHQEQKARAQVVSDVTQAYAGYVAARDMVQRMEKDLLQAAKVSRDLEELMYQKGAASLLDFLDAERTYIATNLEYRQDLEAYWAAVYQLEEATALKLQ